MVKKKVLLLVGGLYHPFEAGAQILKHALEVTGRYEISIREDRDSVLAANLVGFDAVLSYVCAGELTPEQETGLVEYVKGGRPYVGLHGATTIRGEHPAYDEMLGGRFVTHPPVMEVSVTIADPDHPITRGLSDFSIIDELYILDKFDPTQSHVLAMATLEGKVHPVAYVKSYGKGKVFYLALGHDEQALAHPQFRQMLVQGLAWALE